MPSSRAVAMCWAAMSASVQWVATRTERTPSVVGVPAGRAMVPMPGSSSVVSRRVAMTAGGGLDPLPVGVAAGAVVEAAARQAVAVGDLDGVDAGGVERGGDPATSAGRDAVADGVHAVAQGDVLDVTAVGASLRSRSSRDSLRCGDAFGDRAARRRS